MKILHVISSLEIGGAQRLLSELLPIIKIKGDITLLVLYDIDNELKNRIISNSIKIINLNQKKIYNPLIVLQLIKIIKEYDIIHVHLFPTLYWVGIASLFCSHKILLYTEHSTFNKRRNHRCLLFFEKYIYSLYNIIISISKQTQINLISWLQKEFEDPHFKIIENGINLNLYSKINNQTNNKNLIMISRFVDSKDQQTVIKAMPYIDNNINLFFVGDGNTKDDCISLAKKLNVIHRIKFLGTRNDIPQLIQDSYIGIQSSNWEGFGLSALEIMASKRPIIASNIHGLKEIVENAGLLFEKGNEKQLANHINTLINDEAYYNKIANSCYNRAKIYSIENMANRYYNLYEYLYKTKLITNNE